MFKYLCIACGNMHKIQTHKLLGKNPPLRRKILLEYIKSPSGVADRILAETLGIDQSDLVKQHLSVLKKTYLFNWNNIPGDDDERLLGYLTDDHDIEWAKNAEIRKSDDGKTIHIYKDENSAEITIEEEEEKATLKISDDDRTQGLQVKEKNGKLNVYKESGLISECSVAVTRPMGRARTPTEINMNGHCWSRDIDTIITLLLSNVFEPDDEGARRVIKDLLIYHEWIPVLVERFDELLPPFRVASRPSKYFFSWDNVLGKDEKRIVEYFRNDLSIDQVENVEIHKSDNGKTIHILNGDRSAKVIIDDRERAHIKINNKRFCSLNIKKENGKRNLYTRSTVENYPTHYEMVGGIETGDDVSSVMEKYHLPEGCEECIENILKNLPAKKYLESKLKLESYIDRLRGFSDDVKYEDISFVIIKPHLETQERRVLEESLRTNWLALKFISYFLSANCRERSDLIDHIGSNPSNIFEFPDVYTRLAARTTLSYVASRTDIPSADNERMDDELFDGFERNLAINWMEFFDQLDYFRYFRFLFA
jgi:hypothetical protein